MHPLLWIKNFGSKSEKQGLVVFKNHWSLVFLNLNFSALERFTETHQSRDFIA